MSCPAIVEGGRRRGERCGRRITAFVAPGQGRCGYHATARHRFLVHAVLAAVGDMRGLRDLPPEPEPPDREREHEHEAERDDDTFEGADIDWPGAGWTDITEDIPG